MKKITDRPRPITAFEPRSIQEKLNLELSYMTSDVRMKIPRDITERK